MNETGSHGEDDVTVAARRWFVRMRGDVPRDERIAHQAWLVESIEHRRAYERVRRGFAGTALLKSSRKFGPPIRVRSTVRPQRRWAVAGTAAAAMLLLLFGAGRSDLPRWMSQDAMSARAAEPLRTGKGEIRRFRLADGSSLILDTDSEAEVTVRGPERHMRLIRGRARLIIAADSRPFHIAAGASRLASRDATIDLAVGAGGQVDIAVARGFARLQSAVGGATRALAAGASAQLLAGKRVEHGAAGSARLGRDWTTGWAEHRSIPLGQLITDTNRYAAKPIRLDVPSLAGKAVSGRFHISDPESVAAGIALLHDLKLVERADAIHLVRK